MAVLKILRQPEWAEFEAAGRLAGSPLDLRDGFVHLSTPIQVAETLELHFAGEAGLVLVALDEARLVPELRWEVSRGGALFPHLFRAMTAEDVLWAAPIPLAGGRHVVPSGP